MYTPDRFGYVHFSFFHEIYCELFFFEKIVDPAQFEVIFKDAVNFDTPCLLEIMLQPGP